MSDHTDTTSELQKQILEMLVKFEQHREKTGVYEDWTLSKEIIALLAAQKSSGGKRRR